MDCSKANLVRAWEGIRVTAAAAGASAFLCWVLAALLLAVLPGTLTAGPSPAFAAAGPVALGPGAGGRWWKLRITQQGLYHIGCDQLRAVLGVPLPELATLQLYGGGGGGLPPAEVALREVDANGDRRCDGSAGDAVEFWGDPNPGRYAAAACYWLTAGSAPGLRMAQRPSAAGGAPSPPLWRTQLVEENRYYRSSMPVAEAGGAGSAAHDHWFWTFLALGSSTFPSQHDFPFTLDAVAQGDMLPAAAAFVTITLAALGGSHARTGEHQRRAGWATSPGRAVPCTRACSLYRRPSCTPGRIGWVLHWQVRRLGCRLGHRLGCRRRSQLPCLPPLQLLSAIPFLHRPHLRRSWSTTSP